MPTLKTPAGDLQTVHEDLVDYFTGQGWHVAEEAPSEEAEAAEAATQDQEIPEAGVDAALRIAGLDTTGTAEAKRARLAEHNNTPEE